MDEQSKTCLEEMYYSLTTLQLTLMTCSIHVLCLPLPSCTSPFYPLFTLPSLPLPSPPLPLQPFSLYPDPSSLCHALPLLAHPMEERLWRTS